MAEVPLAFGIAANVIQFVDFAFKVLHTGHQMYKFQRNSTQENRELEYIGADLKNVAEGLDASLRDAQLHQNLSPDESQLRQLAEHCKTVCVELLEALEKLRGSGQPRRWRTLLAALKSVCGEGRIEALKKRVEELRQALIVRLLFSLRY